MNGCPPSASVVMTILIDLPGDLPEQLQDVIVDDLTYESHIERLKLIIKQWSRFISGVNCHIAIDVE